MKVAVAVALDCRPRQLHASDILGAAKAASKGSIAVRLSRLMTASVGLLSSKSNSSRFAWPHDRLVTVIVVVEVVLVLLIKNSSVSTA